MSEAVMRADRLGKRYGAADALRDLDLEVTRGEVLGYLGPNGAGKTTTIRLFLGLIRLTSGRAELFGLDAQRDAVQIHRRVAYVPGEASLWPSLTGAGWTTGICVSWWSCSTSILRRRSGPTPRATGRRST